MSDEALLFSFLLLMVDEGIVGIRLARGGDLEGSGLALSVPFGKTGISLELCELPSRLGILRPPWGREGITGGTSTEPVRLLCLSGLGGTCTGAAPG